jgi:hypothetical protein
MIAASAGVKVMVATKPVDWTICLTMGKSGRLLMPDRINENRV